MSADGLFSELGEILLPPESGAWVPDFSSEGQASLRDLSPDAPAWRATAAAWDAPGVRTLCVAHAGAERAAAIAVEEIALALAESGREVLVIDLGLDRPTFQKPFQYQPDEGIVDMALFGTSAGAALRKTPHERIRIVTVGTPPIDAAEVYASKELEEIVASFRLEWNAIVMLAPVGVAGSGVCVALRTADAALLVLPSDFAPVRELAAEIASLPGAPRVLGILRARRSAPGERPRAAASGAPATGVALTPAPPSPAPAPAAPSAAHPTAVPTRPSVTPAAGAPPSPAAPPLWPPPPRAPQPDRGVGAASESAEPAPSAKPVPSAKPEPSAPAPVPASPAHSASAFPAAPAAPAAPTSPAPAAPRAVPPAAPAARPPAPPAAPAARALSSARPIRSPRERRGLGSILAVVFGLLVVALAVGIGLARLGGGRNAKTVTEAPVEAPPESPAETPVEAPTELASSGSQTEPGANAAVDSTDRAAGGAAPTRTPPSEAAPTGSTPTEIVPAPSSEPPPSTSPSNRPSSTPPSTAGAPFGFQVASFASRVAAADDSAKWAAQGQTVTIMAKEIPEKGGTWYRVVLGNYPDRSEAVASAERFKAESGLTFSPVVTLPAR